MKDERVIYLLVVVLGALVGGAFWGTVLTLDRELMNTWGMVGGAAVLWGTYKLFAKD